MNIFESIPDGMNRNAAVTVSGGLDSSVLTAHLLTKGWNVIPIAMDDNSMTWHSNNRQAIRSLCIGLGLVGKLVEARIPEMDFMRMADGQGFCPGRKHIMQTVAMSYAQLHNCSHLFLGYIDSNNTLYRDESEASIQKIAESYNFVYNTQIQVVSPYRPFEKSDVVTLGSTFRKHPGLVLEDTYSCYDGMFSGVTHCGACYGCHLRWVAFRDANVLDYTDYKRTRAWQDDGCDPLIVMEKMNILPDIWKDTSLHGKQ